MAGFKLNWHIENGSLPDVREFVSEGPNTTKDRNVKNNEQFWDQKYDVVENSCNVLTLMKMVRESKKNDVDEKDVWKSILKHRWSSQAKSRG